MDFIHQAYMFRSSCKDHRKKIMVYAEHNEPTVTAVSLWPLVFIWCIFILLNHFKKLLEQMMNYRIL